MKIRVNFEFRLSKGEEEREKPNIFFYSAVKRRVEKKIEASRDLLLRPFSPGGGSYSKDLRRRQNPLIVAFLFLCSAFMTTWFAFFCVIRTAPPPSSTTTPPVFERHLRLRTSFNWQLSIIFVFVTWLRNRRSEATHLDCRHRRNHSFWLRCNVYRQTRPHRRRATGLRPPSIFHDDYDDKIVAWSHYVSDQ